MQEFHVNVFQFRISELRKRASSGIKFKGEGLDCIESCDGLFLDMANRIEDVYWFQKGTWLATTRAMYLVDPHREKAIGEFSGIAEVGSRGQIQRLRGADGSIPYDIKTDDASMREFFFYLELPPDSSLGFLVVERRGVHSAAPAIQSALKKCFHRLEHLTHFRKVVDSQAFDEYLDGHIKKIRAIYIPQANESRDTLKRARVMHTKLSKKEKEDFEIEISVNRPIDQKVKRRLQRWLTVEGANRPKIVTLPVDDEPDKLMITIDGPHGTKTLYPEMISDIALSWDLTSKVSRGTDGVVDVTSARAAIKAECAILRPQLAT